MQNELSYALEHMGKYVGQANGTKDDPGIKLIGSAFHVRVDMNNLKSPPDAQTPNNTADDAWISYSLVGNILSTDCTPCDAVNFPGSCASFVDEDLGSKIVSGFSNTAIPDPLPDPLTDGFYVYIDPAESNVAEVGLIGRYKPLEGAHFIKNPQVVMKVKLICNNCSTN